MPFLWQRYAVSLVAIRRFAYRESTFLSELHGGEACDAAECGREVVGVVETYIVCNFLEGLGGVHNEELALLDARFLYVLVGRHAGLLQENLAKATISPIDGLRHILRTDVVLIILVNEE